MSDTITEIQPSGNDPNMRDVYVDNVLITTLTASTISELHLKVDQPWTRGTSRRIVLHVATTDARRIALELLARRAWGINELTTRLVKRGIEQEIAGCATNQLAKDGWLDDLAYARTLIHQWVRYEPAGRTWLHHKLSGKGIPADIASLAIKAELGDQCEQDAATTLASIRLAKVANLDEKTALRRVRSALGRRGFEVDVALEAIRLAQAGDA